MRFKSKQVHMTGSVRA